MSYKPLSVHQLRELINKGEAKDPLVFLESVMNGQDPRRLSRLYELVMEIDNFNDGDIPKSDWNEVVELVTDSYRYHTVSMKESLTASRTLAEYLHPKRKQVEVSGSTDGKGNSSNQPLTEEEIELFKEKFNDDF